MREANGASLSGESATFLTAAASLPIQGHINEIPQNRVCVVNVFIASMMQSGILSFPKGC